MNRNKLYTVNKWNRSALVPKNRFDGSGIIIGGTNWEETTPWLFNTIQPTTTQQTTSLTPLQQIALNHSTPQRTVSVTGNGTNFSVSRPNNPISSRGIADVNPLGDTSTRSISQGVASGIGQATLNAGIGAATGFLSNAAYKGISGGLSSGVGNGVNSLANTVGGAVSAVNPMLGAGIQVAGALVGGGINKLVGTSTDQRKLNEANAGTASLNNFVSNARSFDGVQGPQAVAAVENAYKGGVFKKGWARRKNQALKDAREAAMQFADNSILNNVNNISEDQLNDALANYAAYGGPLDFGGGALGLMQQNRYFDTIDKRSESLAGKNGMTTAYTGGAKTFDMGGLKASFFDNFGTDPIGAAVRYNRGMEALAAQEEEKQLEAQREADYLAMQQRLNNLETENQGLQALMAAQPTVIPLPVTPVVPEVPVETPASSPTPSKAARDGYIYDVLPQLMKDAGLDIRVTSGYRKAGAVGTAGNRSWHPRHGAVDIVPQGNTTFEDIERTVLTNPEIRDYMLANGFGYLDETDRTPEGKALMQKTGATGNHFHFGKDTSARNNYQRMMSMNAFGGELGTNGTDFTNGLLYVDEGDSHEKNPLGGVPMGVDAEGIPNLVEEGETVYNNYVFSDRMNVPDFMYKELGLGGALTKHSNKKRGISFADASKKLAQESEQRPNDPISQAGLQASLSRLAEVQETERMKKNAEEYMGLEGYACGGKMGRKYGGDGPFPSLLLTGRTVEEENPWIFGYPETETRTKTRTLTPLEQIARDKGVMVTDKGTNLKPYRPIYTSTEDEQGVTEYKPYATWMRYAPVLGAGALTLTDALGLTNRPDYTMADKLEAAARAGMYAPKVKYDPVGNYLRFRPEDIWFEQNALNAQARATDRALANTISPSKAAAIIANGYNSQLASGDLYRKALEYNDTKRERVAEFNRKTNMFNSQMGLEAAMANARYQQQAAQLGLSGLAQAAALRDQIDARIGAAKAANLSNLLTSLGNIGRENFAMNQINSDKSRQYRTNRKGVSTYKRTGK